MKRLVSILLACTIALGVGANTAMAEEKVASIIYNSEESAAFTDVENVDGRIMLPFRAFFEKLGAEVDYKDGMVSAKRGDVSIEFAADENTIKVTDSKGEREITADIKFNAEGDRVMVPVRFVSQALGARVGWNDETKTVSVLDVYPYIEAVKKNCPDFYKYCEKMADAERNVKSDSTLNLGVEAKMTDVDVKADIKGTVTSKAYNNITDTGFAFDFSSTGLDALTGTKVQPAEDISFNVMQDGEGIYIKTNVAEKLTEIMPDNENLKSVADMIGADTWFEIDYSFLEERLGKAYADMLLKGGQFAAAEFFNTLGMAFDREEDVEPYEIEMLDSYFKSFEATCGKFKYTEKGDNSYTLTLNMNADDIISSVVSESMFETAEEYQQALAEVKSTLTFDVDMFCEVVDGVCTDQTVTMHYKVENPDVKLSFVMDIAGTGEKTTEEVKIEKPAETVSVETVLEMLLGTSL